MDEPRFDVSSVPDSGSRFAEVGGGDPPQPSPRPFLGIRFECCKTYGRIYRNDDRTEYSGQCPKCRAAVRVPIGGGGTSSRFFNAR